MIKKHIGIGKSIEVRFNENQELCDKLSILSGMKVISTPHYHQTEMLKTNLMEFGSCQESSLLDMDLHQGIDMLEEMIMIMFQEFVETANIKVGSTIHADTILSDVAYFDEDGELIRKFKLSALVKEPALVE